MLINLVSLLSIKLFVCGVVWHWFADWMLQNAWMADHKSSLKHPAAYVHSGIHLLGLLLIFPWYMACIIAITHLLIDTRIPLIWWRGFFKQTQYAGDATPWENQIALHVAIWTDQVLHIVVIAIASLIVGGLA